MAHLNGNGSAAAFDGAPQGDCPQILRLSAVADVDGDPTTLGNAEDLAADGDADYAWLMERLAQGRVLVLGIDVTAAVARADGRDDECTTRVRGAWVDSGSVPFVELQVSQHAAAGLDDLRFGLRELGVAVQGDWHENVFVHVELSRRLSDALGRGENAVAALSTRDAAVRAMADPMLAAVEDSRRRLIAEAEDTGSLSHSDGVLLHRLVDERGSTRNGM